MINRSSLSVVLVLLASAAHFGQTKVQWQPFEAKAEGLIVQVPFPLEMQGDDKADSPRMYFGQGDKIWLYIFSEPAKKEQRVQTVRQFVESNGQALTFGPDPKQPYLLTFKDGDGYWHHLTAFKLGNREIILQGVSQEIASPVVEKYIASIKVGRPLSVAEPVDEAPVASASAISLQPADDRGPGTGDPRRQTVGGTSATGFGWGTGSGSGIGSGSGNGNGQGPVHPSYEPPKHVTSPLRIISKAKGTFTNYARVYQMTGSVLLRVTFLKSGEIGPVSVIHGLPFGLTGSAIYAAKQIRFEPALMDGTPVTVTKSVEYSFTLY